MGHSDPTADTPGRRPCYDPSGSGVSWDEGVDGGLVVRSIPSTSSLPRQVALRRPCRPRSYHQARQTGLSNFGASCDVTM